MSSENQHLKHMNQLLQIAEEKVRTTQELLRVVGLFIDRAQRFQVSSKQKKQIVLDAVNQLIDSVLNERVRLTLRNYLNSFLIDSFDSIVALAKMKPYRRFFSCCFLSKRSFFTLLILNGSYSAIARVTWNSYWYD